MSFMLFTTLRNLLKDLHFQKTKEEEMKYVNPFVLPPSEYKRDLDIFKHYLLDSSTYLQKMTGETIEKCEAFVRKVLQKGAVFEFKDPPVRYLERGENGDREIKYGSLRQFLNLTVRERDLIAPNMTTYLHPEKKESQLVSFIDENIAKRSVSKKEMFVAKQKGNKTLYAIKNLEQNNSKISNNSLSGAHVNSGNPFYNKTAHSTLTSNCRTTSGYGNANNEKFIAGNRHYWSADIIKNNIISIINRVNYKRIQEVMEKYRLHYPTPAEVMEAIVYSANLYHIDKRKLDEIEQLVYHLEPLELTAFLYVGDFYHLAKYNDNVARVFIEQLSRRVVDLPPNHTPEEIFKAAPDDIRMLAYQICEDEMRGLKIDDILGTPAYLIVVATVFNIMATLTQYEDLINAFYVTPNVPASLGVLPDSIRRVALTSDTDSTIFTVQDWVQWSQGRMGFNRECNAVAATMIFLSAQTITHILAIMSANFGIIEKRIHQVAMKNEFKFSVFVPTQVAKHYFAGITCQEGDIREELEIEIKGVHLKSSQVPKFIIKDAEKMMRYIIDTVMKEEKISIEYIFKWIADMERRVIEGIKSGSAEFFKKEQIKPHTAYGKGPTESPYSTYTFWNEVFGPKYGIVPEPPYNAVKVSVGFTSPTKVNDWLREIAVTDKPLADRFAKWLVDNNKKGFRTFKVPDQVIQQRGIPDEILSSVGLRKMVADLCNVYYLILETLGVYMMNKKITKLVSDYY